MAFAARRRRRSCGCCRRRVVSRSRVIFFFVLSFGFLCLFFLFAMGGGSCIWVYTRYTRYRHTLHTDISLSFIAIFMHCLLHCGLEGLIPSCGGYCSSADQTAQTCQVIGAPRVCSCLFGTAVAVDPIIQSHPRLDHMGLCGAPSGDTNLHLFCHGCFSDSWGRR